MCDTDSQTALHVLFDYSLVQLRSEREEKLPGEDLCSHLKRRNYLKHCKKNIPNKIKRM